MTEAEERERFVKCALSWIGTPYHHHGTIKGVGVDCATLLVCTAKEARLIPQDFDAGYYSPQWHLNRSAQVYLATIGKVCVEVPFPAKSGDIVVFQFARNFAHGGIVIKWPQIVHAHIGYNVVLDDVEKNQMLAFMGEGDGRPRPMKLMSLWAR